MLPPSSDKLEAYVSGVGCVLEVEDTLKNDLLTISSTRLSS